MVVFGPGTETTADFRFKSKGEVLSCFSESGCSEEASGDCERGTLGTESSLLSRGEPFRSAGGGSTSRKLSPRLGSSEKSE